MKTSQSRTRWLGWAMACGTLTVVTTIQAGKPVKPPAPSGPAYLTVVLGGLRDAGGAIVGYAADINNAGQVVGHTALPGFSSGHYSQAFLLNPRDANGDGNPDTWYLDADANGQNDLIIPLGTLPTCASCGRHGFATAVNDLGLVAGTSSGYDFTTKVGRQEVFIVVPQDTNNDGQPDCWSRDMNGDGFNDLMVALGRPPGVPDFFTPTEININNAGQVVGWFYDPNAVYPRVGFLLTPVAVAPGNWQWFQNDGAGANALMMNLGGFFPKSINDRGQVAGMTGVRSARLLNPEDTNNDGVPDLWWRDLDGNGVNDLLLDLKPGGTVSEGITINNRGQLGVWWQVDGVGHAGLLTPLDTNNDGSADTWYRDANGDNINDLIVDLGSLKGLENSYVRPHSLNEIGSVLGGSWHAGRDGLGWNRAAFLWQNGVLQSLKSLTGIEFGDAYAINDAGQIIAVANGREFIETGNACVLVPAL